ncbi:MAG: formimidoylglutamase [Anaerolineae bacterium]|nr:formimidoylglutamase [Anaerolineae bacterium]
MDLFDPRYTCRPDKTLLYRRGDANDVRLGEAVRTAVDDYPDAQVVIVGCPQDEGVRRNGGRSGAASAPTEIRRALYKLSINGIAPVRLFDLGDTIIQPTLEETHDLHQRVVRRIVEDGKRLIVLGGGNDIAYPDCAGLAQAARGDVLAFNVDAHFDVRADPIRNSGTPYRQLLDEGLIQPHHFYEIGAQPFANSPIYEQYLRDKGAHIINLVELRREGIERSFARFLHSQFSILNSIFWGFDLDVVRAAEAPGVSAPNPIGMTGDELCQIAVIAGRDPRTHIVEFSEVNPNYDVDGRTARLTAVAIWHVLAGLVCHIRMR